MKKENTTHGSLRLHGVLGENTGIFPGSFCQTSNDNAEANLSTLEVHQSLHHVVFKIKGIMSHVDTKIICVFSCHVVSQIWCMHVKGSSLISFDDTERITLTQLVLVQVAKISRSFCMLKGYEGETS